MFLLYELSVAFDKLNVLADDSQKSEFIHLYFFKRQAFGLRPDKLRDRRVMIAIRKCNELHNDNADHDTEMADEKEVLPNSRYSILRYLFSSQCKLSIFEICCGVHFYSLLLSVAPNR